MPRWQAAHKCENCAKACDFDDTIMKAQRASDLKHSRLNRLSMYVPIFGISFLDQAGHSYCCFQCVVAGTWKLKQAAEAANAKVCGKSEATQVVPPPDDHDEIMEDLQTQVDAEISELLQKGCSISETCTHNNTPQPEAAMSKPVVPEHTATENPALQLQEASTPKPAVPEHTVTENPALQLQEASTPKPAVPEHTVTENPALQLQKASTPKPAVLEHTATENLQLQKASTPKPAVPEPPATENPGLQLQEAPKCAVPEPPATEKPAVPEPLAAENPGLQLPAEASNQVKEPVAQAKQAMPPPAEPPKYMAPEAHKVEASGSTAATKTITEAPTGATAASRNTSAEPTAATMIVAEAPAGAPAASRNTSAEPSASKATIPEAQTGTQESTALPSLGPVASQAADPSKAQLQALQEQLSSCTEMLTSLMHQASSGASIDPESIRALLRRPGTIEIDESAAPARAIKTEPAKAHVKVEKRFTLVTAEGMNQLFNQAKPSSPHEAALPTPAGEAPVATAREAPATAGEAQNTSGAVTPAGEAQTMRETATPAGEVPSGETEANTAAIMDVEAKQFSEDELAAQAAAEAEAHAELERQKKAHADWMRFNRSVRNPAQHDTPSPI